MKLKEASERMAIIDPAESTNAVPKLMFQSPTRYIVLSLATNDSNNLGSECSTQRLDQIMNHLTGFETENQEETGSEPVPEIVEEKLDVLSIAKRIARILSNQLATVLNPFALEELAETVVAANMQTEMAKQSSTQTINENGIVEEDKISRMHQHHRPNDAPLSDGFLDLFINWDT